MKPSDLYIVYRPSEAKDSLGNDPPCQFYVYFADETGKRRVSYLKDAYIFRHKEYAEQCAAKRNFRVISLSEAISLETNVCFGKLKEQ